MFNKPITEFRGKYFFLSNFYEYPILYDGVFYKSSEHAYQAQKTFDADEIEAIKGAKTPGKSKRLAKEATIREDWESVKIDVMRDVLWAKFSNPDLCKELLATGSAYLIEGNDWEDHFWGICDGKGKNILGKLLMEIRDELKKPEKVMLP